MWICRSCAAHVADDVRTCPCCETAAPAQIQPESADLVSDEAKEPSPRAPINWLTIKALPSLRKRAQSPWSWVLFGFVLGLCCGAVNFRSISLPAGSPELALLQPIMCGTALALVFGLLVAVLRSRRESWDKYTHPVEVGGIVGFFLMLILAVIDAFTNHWGWESLRYLANNSVYVVVFGLFLAFVGALLGGVVWPMLKILAVPLGRWFRHRNHGPKRRRRRERTRSNPRDRRAAPNAAESSDQITEKDGRLSLPRKDNFDIQQGID